MREVSGQHLQDGLVDGQPRQSALRKLTEDELVWRLPRRCIQLGVDLPLGNVPAMWGGGGESGFSGGRGGEWGT